MDMDILLWKNWLLTKKFIGGGVIIKLFNKSETKDNRQNLLLLAVLQQTYM